MSVSPARLVPKSTFAERPLQAESMPAQFATLGLSGGSELEIRFAKALVYVLTDPTEYGPPNYVNLLMPRLSLPSMASFPPIKCTRVEGAVNVMPECEMGAYRADFGVMAKAYGKGNAIIKASLECDGHDWHERTKEQVSYGRKRDRQLNTLGIEVLHYPGSDVNRDARQCARDAINVLTRMSIARRS